MAESLLFLAIAPEALQLARRYCGFPVHLLLGRRPEVFGLV